MTYQEYHEKFKAFLASALKSKSTSEEERDQIVADAEGLMTDFIRAEIDPHFALYAVEGDASKGDWYLDLRKRLSSQPELSEGFDCARLKDVLKCYANFVRSKEFRPNKATLAAGELALKAAARKKTQKARSEPIPDVLGEEEPSANELSEGALRQVSQTTHERNRTLRQLCLKHFGATCQACGMKFETAYGEIGKGYIEVHHLSPISQTGGKHKVDPKTDLVPLCANCHAMIHRLMSAEKNNGVDLEGGAALEKLREIVHNMRGDEK